MKVSEAMINSLQQQNLQLSKERQEYVGKEPVARVADFYQLQLQLSKE